MSAMDIIKGFWSGQGKTGLDAPTAVPASAPDNPLMPTPSSAPKSDGSVAAIPPTPTGDKSSLAGYEKMWDKADTDRKPVDAAYQFQTDPKKLQDATSQIDFMKVIPPDLMAKATGGDLTAFATVINRVAQQATATSAQTTAELVNTALREQDKKYKDEIIPQVLADHASRTLVRAENPLFNNPAVSPVLAMVESQLMTKYPGASPQDISAKAREYISAMGTEIVTGSGKVISDAPKVTPGSQEMDWAAWSGV